MPRAFRRFLIAWFAVGSLLLNGLLPLAAQAAPSLPAMAICSAEAGTAPVVSGKSLASLAHCLDCCSGSHQLGLPVAVATGTAHVALSAPPLPASSSLARPFGPPFHQPQPRAPPHA